MFVNEITLDANTYNWFVSRSNKIDSIEALKLVNTKIRHISRQCVLFMSALPFLIYTLMQYVVTANRAGSYKAKLNYSVLRHRAHTNTTEL